MQYIQHETYNTIVYSLTIQQSLLSLCPSPQKDEKMWDWESMMEKAATNDNSPNKINGLNGSQKT
jgi:hypothetical protein